MAKNKALTFMNTVKLKVPERNKFNLGHKHKTSGKIGNIMPFYVQETYPGDVFTLGNDCLIRMAPMLAPIMHDIDVYMEYYFVPNRILWPGWEEFISPTKVAGQPTPPVPAHPYISVASTTSTPEKQFLKRFGVTCPTGPNVLQVNALPFYAYQKIYNDYFRDQNLIAEINCEAVDGNNVANTDLLVMRKVAYEHDYFTAALPWVQKGDPVALPLGEITLNPNWDADGQYPFFKDDAGTPLTGPVSGIPQPAPPLGSGVAVGLTPAAYDPNGSLTVTPTLLNDLRVAARLQEWKERMSVGGSRLYESIKAFFGIDVSDARMQRPEWIVGNRAPLVISEVLNSTGPMEYYDAQNERAEQMGEPQGSMAGHGVSYAAGNTRTYECPEHGWIIGVMYIRPRTGYFQGIPKWSEYNDIYDYYWPQFAHLGEQAVLNRELYVDHPQPNGTFGYMPRYAHLKYTPSLVSGDFAGNLDYWHCDRKFSAPPALNQDFIEVDPADIDRIFAVQDGTDYLWIEVTNNVTALRPIPFFGEPTL